jgi:hypothetical protein
MPAEVTTEDLEALLTDPDFLFLTREESRPNVFTTVAASTTEMWHSAFIRWVLDPGSHLGLGDFPLKRFLHAVLDEAASGEQSTVLSFADIERLDFSGMSFETEFTAEDLVTTQKGGRAKLDVYAAQTTEDGEEPSVQIVIENKVGSREREDQTDDYYRWASHREFVTSVYVFMTPDVEQVPHHPAFIQLTYQHFCDQVLWPTRRHPALPEESRYLLEQYMLNLNRNAKGESMAQVNQKMCVDIYQRYQCVFDQVYLAVGKEPPRSDGYGQRLRRSAVSLEDLLERGLLVIDGILTSDYGEGGHVAHLVRTEDGVQVQVEGDAASPYPSLSKAASVITSRPTNGWTFWKTIGTGGALIRLDALRDKIIEERNGVC